MKTKQPLLSKTFILVIGCAVLVVGFFFILGYSQLGKEATPKTFYADAPFWEYSYEPLGMKVILKSEWKEIPTASLVLPYNFSGVRFAFKKKDTSCVLAYVTASEGVLAGYVNVTKVMAEAGKITDSELLLNIPNPNIDGPHSITAMIPEERLGFFRELQETGRIQSPISFHDAEIIFISSHFGSFKESSRQSPMFVLYDDGTSGVPWDGYCLSDMVRVLKEVDVIR